MSDEYISDPTADDYATAAVVALQKGRLSLAVEQIAACLAMDPLHPAHLSLLHRILDASDDPIGLTLVRGEVFFGRFAVHALALARAGRLAEAIPILFQAIAFRPEIPYLAWLDEWGRDAKLVGTIPDSVVESTMIELLAVVDKGPQRAPGLWLNVEAAVAFAMASHHARRVGSRDRVLLVAGMLLRKLGAFDEAAAVVSEHASVVRSWAAYSELGVIQSARGDVLGAQKAFEQATLLQPDEPSTFIDLGDVLVGSARFEAAAAAYDKAIACGRSDPATRALRLRARAWDGDMSAIDELAQLAAHAPQVHALVEEVSELITRLPPPDDDLSRVVRNAIARAAKLTSDQPMRVRIRANEREPPSLRRAFQAALARLGRRGELIVEVEGTQTSLTATEPPQPAADALAAVAELAARPFHIDAWLREASARSAVCDPVQWARVIAHPPNPPSTFDSLDWVYRCQVAAAMFLPADGLLPLLADDDWSTEAASIALLAHARADEGTRDQVIAAFDRRLAAPASERLGRVLAGCRLRLGPIAPSRGAELWRQRQRQM